MKYTYKTETDKKGNVYRYRCWKEPFVDEDTRDVVWIKRHELIKVNGDKVRFYSTSEWRKMTKSQRDSISINWKK